MLIVTYDLFNASLEDYIRLGNEIKTHYPTALKATESCWYLPINETASAVLLALGKYFNPNDRLLVAELKTFPLGKNLISDLNPFAKLHHDPRKNPFNRY